MAVLQWAVYPAQLLPLALFTALAIYAQIRKRPRPADDAWQIATALAFSFAADAVARKMMGMGINNNIVMHFAAPVQFGLLLHVFRPRDLLPATLVMVLLTLAAASDGFVRPERWIQFVMGAWVAWAAYRSVGPYRWPVILYCAAAVPLVVWTSLPPALAGPWLVAFGAYHVVRLVALLCVVAVLAGSLYPRRQEATVEHVGRVGRRRGRGSSTHRSAGGAGRERLPVRAGPAGWHY